MPLFRTPVALRSILRYYSTNTRPPPTPGPYKTLPAQPKKPSEAAKPNNITTPESLTKPAPEPLDPARGIEASRRVVTEGKLDPRYRAAAWRVTAIICAAPIAIYTTWVLYERQYLGVEQKKHDFNGGRDEREGVGIFGARESVRKED